MVSQHFPALQVILPLLMAPVCVLLRGARLALARAVQIVLRNGRELRCRGGIVLSVRRQ